MQLKKVCAICFAVLVASLCSFPLFATKAEAASSLAPIQLAIIGNTGTIGFEYYMGSPAPSSNIHFAYHWNNSYDSIAIPSSESAVFWSISGYKWDTTKDYREIENPVKVTNYRPVFGSNQFQPESYDRYVVFMVGFGEDSRYSTPSSDGTVYYTKGSYQQFSETGAVGVASRVDSTGATTADSYWRAITVKIPADATSISFTCPLIFRNNDFHSQNAFVSYGGWVTDNYNEYELIFRMTGYLESINSSSETAVTLINSCLTQLRSISSSTSSIDSTTTSIYQLLKDALSSETAALDRESQAAADKIMQQDNAEQYWNDKNQSNFEAIGLDHFTFGDGVVSALGTVGGLFEGIWNAMGDATIIFTFPLILGISLVVIGRISRSAGKGSSKKEGDGG